MYIYLRICAVNPQIARETGKQMNSFDRQIYIPAYNKLSLYQRWNEMKTNVLKPFSRQHSLYQTLDWYIRKRQHRASERSLG